MGRSEGPRGILVAMPKILMEMGSGRPLWLGEDPPLALAAWDVVAF